MKNNNENNEREQNQMSEIQRLAKQFDNRIDRPWICPGCGARFELEADINDCECWRRNYDGK